MKKLFSRVLMLALLAALCLALPALAETVQTPAQTPEPTIDAPGVEAPLTWSYLATIAGAAAFTLLIVQFFKAPLDKVWKIPTRVFAYMVSLAVMLIATAFTSGLTAENVLLVAANAFLAAMSAYGAYELTFAKIEKA